jgi:CRP/FNR family transcriptional regulator/CRP/FNR family cyclic AMP-dependent transcriptional regulator
MELNELNNISLFHGLGEQQIEDILVCANIRDHRKYEMILFEDQLEAKFFIILNGRVKISRYTEDGQEAVLSFLGEGDFFGEMAVFEDEYRDSNVMTIEPSRILSIHREDFLNLMTYCSQLNINLLKEMTQKIRRRNAHIKSLTIQNATGKVASTILRLADDCGAINLGKIEISRLPTHKDLANMVGTSRETISRVLKFLTKNGYIQRNGHKLVICDYQEFRASFS